MNDRDVIDLIRPSLHELTGSPREDYDPLLDLIGDAHFVLLGEASHGTHEFYRERAEITKRLIAPRRGCGLAGCVSRQRLRPQHR